jgi:hypothetical protein
VRLIQRIFVSTQQFLCAIEQFGKDASRLFEGELDLASSDGTRAHDLGIMRKDDVLQARSRVLQTLVECAKVEEQIEDGESDDQSLLLAYEFARDAVAHAKCTQNRRLTAKSYIALGLAICASAPEEMETAWECCDQATALLNPENKDYVWRCLLQSLKNKLRNEGHIDSSTGRSSWRLSSTRSLLPNHFESSITRKYASI